MTIYLNFYDKTQCLVACNVALTCHQMQHVKEFTGSKDFWNL